MAQYTRQHMGTRHEMKDEQQTSCLRTGRRLCQLALYTISIVWSVTGFCDALPSSYGLNFMSQLQVEGPCISSLIGPPTQGCIQWEPNVIAFAVYDPSRLLIFAGAADDELHVVKAESGLPYAKIHTMGRVSTETKIITETGRMVCGTEKGVLHGFHAYTFEKIFDVIVDSKINSDLLQVRNDIIFTTSLGTIYSVDTESGTLKWQLPRPSADERIKLLPYSNIVGIAGTKDNQSENTIIAPHHDGYVSHIDSEQGVVDKQINLSRVRSQGYPDVVAPMVLLNNRLWVASVDSGITIIELVRFRIREEIKQKEIMALKSDGEIVYAASPDAIYAYRQNGSLVWKRDISKTVSRTPRAPFPFDRFNEGYRRMFLGAPSGLLVNEKYLVLATSLGSIGIFDKFTGKQLRILGNSVGFGSINWADSTSIIAVSRRGVLMSFKSE